MKRSPLKPGRRKRKTLVPPAIRMIAMARSSGLCVTCGAPAHHLHHTFDEALYPEFAAIADNLIALCLVCHGRHHNAFTRIPRAKLPAVTVALADGDDRLLLHLERYYP